MSVGTGAVSDRRPRSAFTVPSFRAQAAYGVVTLSYAGVSFRDTSFAGKRSDFRFDSFNGSPAFPSHDIRYSAANTRPPGRSGARRMSRHFPGRCRPVFSFGRWMSQHFATVSFCLSIYSGNTTPAGVGRPRGARAIIAPAVCTRGATRLSRYCFFVCR